MIMIVIVTPKLHSVMSLSENIMSLLPLSDVHSLADLLVIFQWFLNSM